MFQCKRCIYRYPMIRHLHLNVMLVGLTWQLLGLKLKMGQSISGLAGGCPMELPPCRAHFGGEEMVRQLKQRCQSLEAQLQSKRCASDCNKLIRPCTTEKTFSFGTWDGVSDAENGGV